MHDRNDEKSGVTQVEADLTDGQPFPGVRGSFVKEGILSGRMVDAKVQTWKSMRHLWKSERLHLGQVIKVSHPRVPDPGVVLSTLDTRPL